MTKYTQYLARPEMKPRPWKVHPIWRGIGCLMLIIIPVLSYAGAVLLVQENFTRHWVPLPPELAATITLPFLGSIPNLFARLLVTLVLIFVGFAGMSAVYAIIYSIAGPPRLGPLDAPPDHRPFKRSR